MSFGDEPELSFDSGKKLNRDQVRTLFADGFDKLGGLCAGTDRQSLTSVLSMGGNADNKLDLELAWIINFRTVLSGMWASMGCVAPCRRCLLPGSYIIVRMRAADQAQDR
jgi:hypothetical protein